ncbi:hypothetical protein EV138_1766 [Kribbella voronezhensis]|uniref:Uncharacterized protein n=1 Tax=Kribbella voronezhensis TaxID=2512212 RepID=A0A4R7T8I5_9ACTN|nr:hypothetical protein [Kribbella voronezhensis]TDU88224.1 hypothetical protein EV138_1766 [Kribbella voronezhensis]
MRRHFGPTVLTIAAVAGVVTFSLVASAPAGTAASTPSSAYGITATGQVPVAKTPYVESPDGKRHTSAALELPQNPLIALRAGNVSAGNDSASVELFDLTVGPDLLKQIKIPPELKQKCATLPATGAGDLPIPELPLPDLGLPLPKLSTKDLPVKNLPDLCNLLLTPPSSLLAIDSVNVYCTGDSGAVDIGSLTLLGQKIAVPSTKQSVVIPAAPLAKITVNEQTKGSDGSFTITALTIDLGNGAEVIKLASATCAKPAAKPTPKPTHQPTIPQPTEPGNVPPAPVPKPVKTHHAVTG